MTLFVLAQLLYISLHVEKNEKGTTIRGKKRQIQKTECLVFFNLSL